MADSVNDEKEEDRLWEEYRKTKSQALRDAFIRQYMPLVKYVAGKVSVGMPGSVEFDDLVGFGQFGLLDAIEKYDPSKNVKFKTYAVTRIRGAIFDELRQIDWVPRSVRQIARNRGCNQYARIAARADGERCGNRGIARRERRRLSPHHHESVGHERAFPERRVA